LQRTNDAGLSAARDIRRAAKTSRRQDIDEDIDQDIDAGCVPIKIDPQRQ
jgi:hypothetical protein